MPGIEVKIVIIKKYLSRLRDFDGSITTDHISGWENQNALAPDHLTGSRYFNYKAGQEARKLRDRDWYTHIISSTAIGEMFSKTFAGRLSHKKIIEICEKACALQDIKAYIVDRATGNETLRDIGY